MRIPSIRDLVKRCRLSIVNCQLMVVMAAIAVTTISCDGPKTIPDNKLESIITDILLTEGVRNSGMKIHTDVPIDSVDFYSPVLDRYGYSIVDFRYTINELATRKSNPLKGIISNVVKTIDDQAQIAQYRYDIARRFDSLALSAYADTVYKLDSTIIGSLKKFRVKLDSVKAGDYRVTFSYQSMLDYRFPQKSLRYYFAQKGDKKPVDVSVWINRNEKLTDFNSTLSTIKDRDSLILYFIETTINRSAGKKEGLLKDTSIVRDIMVVYTPSIEEARSRYYNQIFGGDLMILSELFKNNEQQKDSLPGPVGLRR